MSIYRIPDDVINYIYEHNVGASLDIRHVHDDELTLRVVVPRAGYVKQRRWNRYGQLCLESRSKFIMLASLSLFTLALIFWSISNYESIGRRKSDSSSPTKRRAITGGDA